MEKKDIKSIKINILLMRSFETINKNNYKKSRFSNTSECRRSWISIASRLSNWDQSVLSVLLLNWRRHVLLGFKPSGNKV